MNKLLTVAFISVGSFVAGLLLAPKSGKETRQDLMTKANEYTGKAKAGIEEVKVGASAVKDEIVDSAGTIKDIVKDAGDGAKRTANRVKEEATSRAKVIQGEVKDTAQNTRKATK
jgi:gas vesicle protein